MFGAVASLSVLLACCVGSEPNRVVLQDDWLPPSAAAVSSVDSSAHVLRAILLVGPEGFETRVDLSRDGSLRTSQADVHHEFSVPDASRVLDTLPGVTTTNATSPAPVDSYQIRLFALCTSTRPGVTSTWVSLAERSDLAFAGSGLGRFGSALLRLRAEVTDE